MEFFIYEMYCSFKPAGNIVSEYLILANVFCMCMFCNLHKSSGWSVHTLEVEKWGCTDMDMLVYLAQK